MKLFKWITESNRLEHFIYGGIFYLACVIFTAVALHINLMLMWLDGIFLSFAISVGFVVCLALGMEYKDKLYGNKFDFLDFLATILFPLICTLLLIIINILH